MPQNVLAETELRHLAAIPWQIISPSGNMPLIGIYQDSMLGSYRFTRPSNEIKLTQRDAMNLLMMYPNVDVEALKAAGKNPTNFDVLSQVIPPITLKYKTKLFDESEDTKTSNNMLEIRNGKYIRGQLDKSCLASTTKGIIHRVCNDYGNMAGADFIDNLQNIITEYMKGSAFSVGVSDLIANKKTQDEIIQAINAKKHEVKEVIDKVHLGVFENNTSYSNMSHFETTINNILNKATEDAGKIGRKSLGADNRFLMIVNSGSKGNLINISQMISCLGQQNVDGKRIPYGFDSRTLPHYSKFDDSPTARGFVENSYIAGLTAPELFFHAMGGRVGLIDTACKTAQTGYIQRRLIKGLEDLKVVYDMTVRNNRDRIVQFAYGEDGFDSTKAENQAIPLVGMSVEDIYMHFDILGINDERSDLLNVYTKSTITRLKRQRVETQAKCQKYIDKMLEYRTDIVANVFNYKNDTNVQVPVSFQNIIANIQGQLQLSSNSICDISPLEVFQLIEATYDNLLKLHYTRPTKLFETLYFYYLSPKDLLVNKRFHRRGIELILEMVSLKYKQAIVHPGEMVGVIAGQSIGEPTTQLTLNSVTYETEILVRDQDKRIFKVQIGDFTKEHMAKCKKIDYTADKDTSYAEMSEYYEVPSATEDGRTVWRRIEAVTQHPVINKDGTNTMLKVTTKGCREVIATKAKSFLQLIDGKIQGVNGDELKVGEYLPVSKRTIRYVSIFESGSNDTSDAELEIIKHDKDSLSIPNKVDGVIQWIDREESTPDLLFDEIISIEEVANTTSYAYDLTVEDTRTFDLYNAVSVFDTFHLAGVASKSNVTRGVPRIEEILRLTKNPKKPSLTIHLKPIDELEKDRAETYANMLEHTRLVDVVKSVQIHFDPVENATFLQEDKQLLEQFYEFERLFQECAEIDSSNGGQRSKWIIRLEIDAETMLDKNLTMDDIHFALTHAYNDDISCTYSDYNESNLVFRIRMSSDIFSKKKRGNASNLDQSDEIYLLKNFQDNILNNIVLRGIQGIENVQPRKLQNMVIKEDGKYVTKNTWIMDTTGTNLLEVLAQDFIDNTRTYSNDIREIFDVLGIEAARQAIYNEMVEVMTSDVYINYHHLSLLCDRMTVTKDMVPIFRSGILNDDIGPIAKATFEVHTEVLLNAARHADFDEMRGVSANVMCGQFGYYGTNSFNMVLDMKEFSKLQEAAVDLKNSADEIEKLFGLKDSTADECSTNNILIRNNISAIQQENIGICDDSYDIGI